MRVDIPQMVEKTTEDLKAGIVYPRPIFVKALLDSNLSEEEKSTDRISAEVLGILGAGTETTAWWVFHQIPLHFDRPIILFFFSKTLKMWNDTPSACAHMVKWL